MLRLLCLLPLAACTLPPPATTYEPIYFDTHGHQIDSAVKNGYQRLILRRHADGTWLAQDFYATGQQRSDTFRTDQQGLHRFPSDARQYGRDGTPLQTVRP